MLEKLISMLRAQRVGRIRMGDLEIELHPSAYVVAPQPEGEPPRDTDRCDCTHSLQVEHNTAGCLLGCSAELCARTGINGAPGAMA